MPKALPPFFLCVLCGFAVIIENREPGRTNPADPRIENQTERPNDPQEQQPPERVMVESPFRVGWGDSLAGANSIS